MPCGRAARGRGSSLEDDRDVGFGEAEDAVKGDRGVVDRVAYGGDLSVEAVDDLRSVAAVDEELWRAEPRTFDADLAGVVLGVDDVHARRGDGEMVDVGAAARHPPVVQEDDRPVGDPLLERLADSALARRASLPRGLVLRCVAQQQEEASDARMALVGALLAAIAAALMLARGARSGLATFQRFVRQDEFQRGGADMAVLARHRRAVASHHAPVPGSKEREQAAHASGRRSRRCFIEIAFAVRRISCWVSRSRPVSYPGT